MPSLDNIPGAVADNLRHACEKSAEGFDELRSELRQYKADCADAAKTAEANLAVIKQLEASPLAGALDRVLQHGHKDAVELLGFGRDNYVFYRAGSGFEVRRYRLLTDETVSLGRPTNKWSSVDAGAIPVRNLESAMCEALRNRVPELRGSSASNWSIEKLSQVTHEYVDELESKARTAEREEQLALWKHEQQKAERLPQSAVQVGRALGVEIPADAKATQIAQAIAGSPKAAAVIQHAESQFRETGHTSVESSLWSARAINANVSFATAVVRRLRDMVLNLIVPRECGVWLGKDFAAKGDMGLFLTPDGLRVGTKIKGRKEYCNTIVHTEFRKPSEDELRELSTEDWLRVAERIDQAASLYESKGSLEQPRFKSPSQRTSKFFPLFVTVGPEAMRN